MASDLQEVQNVVESTFGNMTQKVEDFAKSAITQFGLSEVSAKRAASTFKAMGNGMGVANAAGADMAITLAGLSGDLASFWNTTTEQAQTALKGVYTGETEALKSYGVVMTETALSAFALSKGIRKSYTSMSQAEKVGLRYEYVMKATADAQGDFAKTSGSWANQVRILKEQWSQLLTIIGSGLVRALTPAIKALNNLLSTVIDVANAVSEAFSRVFGTEQKKISINNGNISDDFGDIKDSVDDATGSVQDLNKELGLTSFDEIEKLSSPIETNGGINNGDSGNIFDEEIIDGDDSLVSGLEKQSGRIDEILIKIRKKFQELKESIPTLELKIDTKSLTDNMLGVVDQLIESTGNIAGSLAGLIINVLNDIDINKAISDITTILSNVLKSFEIVVTSVLGAINKVLKDLGFGKIINDLLSLGSTFTTLVNTVLETVVPAFEKLYDNGLKPIVEWTGGKIQDGLKTVENLFKSWDEWFKENKEVIIEWNSQLGIAVNELWKLIEPLADSTWETFKNTLVAINEQLQNFLSFIISNSNTARIIVGIGAAFAGLSIIKYIDDLLFHFWLTWENTFELMKKTSFAKSVLGVSKIRDVLVLLLADLIKFKNGTLNIKDVLSNLSESISRLPIINFFKTMDEKWAAGLSSLINNTKNGVSNIISVILHPVSAIKNAFSSVISTITGFGGNIISAIGGFLSTIVTNIQTFLSGIIATITNAGGGIKGVIALVTGAIKSALSLVISGIKTLFGVVAAHPFTAFVAVLALVVASFIKAYNTSEEFRTKVQELYENTIKPVIEHIKEIISDLWENHLKPLFDNLCSDGGAIQTLMGIIGKLWDILSEFIAEATITLLPLLIEAFDLLLSVVGPVLGGIIDLINGIVTVLQGVIEFIVGVFTLDWEMAWQGICDIFKGIWDSIKAIIDAIVEAIGNVINKIKEFLGIADKANSKQINIETNTTATNSNANARSIAFTTTDVPKFANGGVLTKPTFGLMGEYPGASNNPEIVTPKRLMESTMEQANLGVINAIFAMASQVVKAIEDKDTDIYMDTAKVTRKITKEQDKQARNKGPSLILA